MKRMRLKIDLLGLVLPVFIVLVWHFSVSCGKVPSYILPSPKSICLVMIDFVWGLEGLSPYSGKLIDNLSVSLFRVFIGFGTAIVSGVSLGFLTGRILLVKRIIDPLIHAVRTVPGIGWLPVAMVWFGVGEKTTVFLIASAAFFPIYLNSAHGASAVPELLLRAGRMLGANKFEEFRTIVLPSSLPSIVVGLRQGLGVSWAYLVLGELTGVSEGLGAVMMDSRMMGQTEMILVSMMFIALTGMLTDRLLVRICHCVLPYDGREMS